MLEGVTGNIESKVRSVAEVLMKFFGATFFLDVEDAVISVIQGLRQSDRLKSDTYGWCGLAMGQVHCPQSRQVGQYPRAFFESE